MWLKEFESYLNINIVHPLFWHILYRQFGKRLYIIWGTLSLSQRPILWSQFLHRRLPLLLFFLLLFFHWTIYSSNFDFKTLIFSFFSFPHFLFLISSFSILSTNNLCLISEMWINSLFKYNSNKENKFEYFQALLVYIFDINKWKFMLLSWNCGCNLLTTLSCLELLQSASVPYHCTNFWHIRKTWI